MKIIARDENGIWRLSRKSHLSYFSLGEIRNPTFPWPRMLGRHEQIPNNEWVWLLGGVSEWGNENRIQVTGSIEVDALWRIKPVKMLESLISACFEAEEEQERMVERQRRTGRSRPSGGGEGWPATKSVYWEENHPEERAHPSWERFRAGRSEETDSERCGSPQSKLNACIKPVVGRDKTRFLIDNLAPSTRTSYWGARNQWVEFSEQRGHSRWVRRDGSDNWGENFLEFYYYSTQK